MGLPKILKRALTAGLALAMAVAAIGCGGGGGKDGETFVNIATGGTAGTYYPIGGAIAEVLNKDAQGVNASAQSTGASVANINMLKDGQVDMAIVQNDITYYAVNGKEMFENKVDKFVVLEDSGIKTIADLKGKRVAVGAAGSGVEGNVRQILKAYDMSYDDIDEQFLSFAEGATALKDGTVDVACLTAGYPTASVQDVASQKKIRLLPIDNDKIESLMKEYPFYTKTTIPKGTYQGFDEDVQTVSVMAILVVNDKLSDDAGYEITKAIFGGLDKISAAHSAAKAISKEKALEGMDFITMNGGAQKFLKE